MSDPFDFEVIVVGGGPSGLSASLVLGRACRRVLLADAGAGRNARAAAVHGFFTRDGTPPAELRRLGADELAPYDVTRRMAAVAGVEARPGGFRVAFEGAPGATARRVLLATGMRDVLPTVGGFGDVYGTSAHHCPYCDGWEWRGAPIAAYAPEKGAEYALGLTSWTPDVVLLTDGHAVGAEDADRLRRHGVAVDDRRVSALRSEGGMLRSVEFEEGAPLARSAFFFHLGMEQASSVPCAAGCRLDADGFVEVGEACETSVPGVFAAGDCTPGPQSVALAVAEGARAAVAVHQDLRREDTR